MPKIKKLKYISLFSGAGLGCFGFKQEGFECVATVEIMEKRLKFQKFNNKCKFESGYIGDDISYSSTKKKINTELDKWSICEQNPLDVLIATPPCQGMSVANHKKGNELIRNSLIVESIKWVMEIQPKFFVFENVRSFLKTPCTDIDGENRKIGEAIELNLSGKYNILPTIINFKYYGCPSSRTRTIVLGVRKDLKEVTPYDILPAFNENTLTLRNTIGHLKPLKNMGDISSEDIYHNFKNYSPAMLDWIRNIKEGESSFDNEDPEKIPHKKNGPLMIFNVNKNGDKYRRQYWDKVAPCIHTRNDIISSQNTIHPKDNRVFSIREVMLMMSIPNNFSWTDKSFEELNRLSLSEKKSFLTQNEMTIRHSLGEGVPTIIFQQIAKKIKQYLDTRPLDLTIIKKIIEKFNLKDPGILHQFIIDKVGDHSYASLSKIAELANTERTDNAAYYTRQDICYSIVNDLPSAQKHKIFRILEPSIGVGNFLPLLIEKYRHVGQVIIDVVDIDSNSLKIFSLLNQSLNIPHNFKINVINDDFLLHHFENKYDLVIGNPPYKKLTLANSKLDEYKRKAFNYDTNNVFSFFIEKALRLGNIVALIAPKSLISTPEFNKTRYLLQSKNILKIVDYGEDGFKGVKIETISLIISSKPKKPYNRIKIESYITKQVYFKDQEYVTSDKFPYWLLYRNEFFDTVSCGLKFNVFSAFRDRQIKKVHTKSQGKIRVLKSRNIASNKIVNIDQYDCYVDDTSNLTVAKYINHEHAILIPNLTYNPRACFLPKETITDGSVAILTIKNGNRKITESDLQYYSTAEYKKFYTIARNYGTRSLNIDKNSVFFFGILQQ
ncbi:hypothetical protein AP064_03995 [Candidatus Liberibacter solanacearum]|uniref:DNA (cytosine-5-)-methyltransferase n=1 Tax=Candidatus Liberibacter solanacearum TaxID=556287 RepID=A0A0F4VKH8_9HYPH|nr:DNA cytosine methyltransferase [Candidatus Liberibacter solanacearum]KJZ81212.1 hypothetical protein KP07_01635 [Candidatus Liberibacter solanacearum]KJZ81684.1 adenine/cytosine DNA methyltransferase [Candidatus Liberibacter solanacearum]KQC48948.1 hypothetical protein AP064_03995 [Candidatus Liberibacter solanacearum]